MAAPTGVALGPTCALRMNRLMTTHTIREAVAADRDWLADCAVAMALETEHKRLEPGTVRAGIDAGIADPAKARRSEEHTSELQSLMRISYAVFCLKKKTHHQSQDLK